MAGRSARYQQKAPAPLYVPSSEDDGDSTTSEEARREQQHRYSTLPEDDYVSPTKDRAGRYTYGQPTPRQGSRPSQLAGSRRRGEPAGRGSADPIDVSTTNKGTGGRFRVRLHHAEGVLDEMAQRNLMAPSLYMALHTAEERGHSRTVHRSYNPVFTDMFDFESSRPDRDALVCTLVALPVTAQGKERKVAECVISLKNLMWGVEREVWVPMVRHAGTKYAYEQGEVKISIFSDDFGVKELPTEEEETAFSVEAQRILRKYAPEHLHRLDWIVGEHLLDGDQGLIDIRARYGPQAAATAADPAVDGHRQRRHHRRQARRDDSAAVSIPVSRELVEDRTVAALSRRSRSSAVNRMLAVPPLPLEAAGLQGQPRPARSPVVRVRVSVQQVADLVGADGGPLVGKSCYLTFRTRANESRSRTYRYHGSVADFGGETFELSLEDPAADPIEVTVCAGGRCVGEAQLGLANVEAGREKTVEVMLVRAADTADASPSGRLRLTLCTPVGKHGYTSPFLWSKSEERKVRDRVLAYLWTYLRDDLHRLDAIVGTIDVPDAFMREWSRTIGPEPEPRHLSLLVHEGADLFEDDLTHAFFVRATCGPYTSRTRTVNARGKNAATIHHALDLTVLNPDRDALELYVIEETPSGSEREVSRILLGLKHLPRRDTLKRAPLLITHACSRMAHEHGQLSLEMVAQDFGVSARHVLSDADFEKSCKSLGQRCAVEERHRIPYVVDTAGPDDDVSALLGPRSAAVEETTAVSKVTPAASAPMTVRVLGFKGFAGTREGCYVAAFLQTGSSADEADDAVPFLRTQEIKRSAPQITLDIGQDNEATTSFKFTPDSRISFRVMRERRLRKDQELARADVALANLICGEKNTLWVPLASAEAAQRGRSGSTAAPASARRSDDRRTEAETTSDDDDDKIRDNHLPKSVQRRAREVRQENESSGFLPPPTAAQGPSAAPSSGGGGGLLGVELWSNAFPITSVVTINGLETADGTALSPMQAVARDVTSLLRRYRPDLQGQAQPMIAQCSSFKEAHRELRAEICPRDVEATVYLHVDEIHMEKMQGREQETRGEIGVVASFGHEMQVTQKRRAEGADTTGNTSGRLVYAPMRLDLPGPEQHRVPPLQLTLVPLTAGATASWTVTRTSTANGTADVRNGASTSSGPYAPRAQADEGTSRRRHRRSTLGGRNNLMNYLNPDAAETASDAASAARRHTYANGLSAEASQSGGAVSGTPTARDTNAGAIARGGAVVVSGGLGTVRLSLRALLSDPIHTLGDRISVPIVSTDAHAAASSTPSWAGRRAKPEPEVVGQLVFHLSAPVFEEFPEWMHLASRSVLSEVDPEYVHYYVRRIGAYLRQCAPAELVDVHYSLFERDVASGSWPVSLHDWVLALQKRFRTREAKDFGPEPPLRFNPEEREARRQMESYYIRQSAFDELEVARRAGRNGRQRSTRRATLEDTPEKGRSRDRCADPEAEVEPRTEPPRRAARSKRGHASHTRTAPTYGF